MARFAVNRFCNFTATLIFPNAATALFRQAGRVTGFCRCQKNKRNPLLTSLEKFGTGV
jgi:hypothetical protein